MAITLHDITPIGLCIATQDLFDAKRFRANFCDALILRSSDKDLGYKLSKLRKELNSVVMGKKFLDGHKTAIISNIDKIASLVSSRYARVDLGLAESVVSSSKQIIQKVLIAETFEDIEKLEPEFKRKVTLPVYELFIGYMKRSKTPVI